MTQPAYSNASTGSVDISGAWTATCHAPAASGRIIILQVYQAGTTSAAVTFTSATNITNLAATANQWTKIGTTNAVGAVGLQHIWIGRSTGTSAPTFTGGNSTSDDVYWRFYEFTNGNTGSTLSDVIQNVTNGVSVNGSGTSASVLDTAVTTTRSDCLALNFIACNDQPQAAELTAMTGGTGGTWTYPVTAYGTTTGTNGTIALVTAEMPVAGTIDGSSDAITSVAWGVVGFALIGTTIDADSFPYTGGGYYP